MVLAPPVSRPFGLHPHASPKHHHADDACTRTADEHERKRENRHLLERLRSMGNCTMPADTPPISEHRLRSTPSLCSTLVSLVLSRSSVKPPEIHRYTPRYRTESLESLRLSGQIFRFVPPFSLFHSVRLAGTRYTRLRRRGINETEEQTWIYTCVVIELRLCAVFFNFRDFQPSMYDLFVSICHQRVL